MSRRTWTKYGLHITYGKPKIQAFRNNIISGTDEIMYFYYDIDILDGKKNIFHAGAYDFPKVQNLPQHIDYIINTKEEDMFLYENIQNEGFCRKKLYTFVTLEDSFDMGSEYFYKIEKTVLYVKHSNKLEFNRYEEYVLTIGKNRRNKSGYSNGEPYGSEIFIQDLSKDDLLELKQTAIDFCNVAIKLYNKSLREYKIKCPKCGEHQLLLKVLTGENEFGDQQFKCQNCKEDFNDDEGIYI